MSSAELNDKLDRIIALLTVVLDRQSPIREQWSALPEDFRARPHNPGPRG